MARVRLKYVNAFRNPQRENDRLRYYFRRRRQRAIALPGQPGSDEFMAAYAAALAGSPETIEIGERRTQPGTIDALVVSYFKSAAWANLTPDTHKLRRRIIERFREQHGAKRVALLRQDHIEKMLARLDKASAKRHWLAAIRALMQAAIPTLRKDDPTAGVASIRLAKSKGHHSWTDDEIAQYRAHWPLGTQQRLVMEFALETVSRRGEVVRLGPQHCKDGWIRIARTHGSDDVEIPMSDELAAAVAAMPRKHLTFIHTAAGQPRSKAGLGLDFTRWATAAGLPKHCRMHGLKKAGMRRAAEDGNTAHELMAKSGHKTLSEVQRYTDAADKRQLAASGHAKRRRSA
jgi:hypothetical protein